MNRRPAAGPLEVYLEDQENVPPQVKRAVVVQTPVQRDLSPPVVSTSHPTPDPAYVLLHREQDIRLKNEENRTTELSMMSKMMHHIMEQQRKQ